MIFRKSCIVLVYSPLFKEYIECEAKITGIIRHKLYKLYIVKIINPVDKAIRREQYITKQQIVRRSLWPEKE